MTYNQVLFYFLIDFVQSLITVRDGHTGLQELLIPGFKLLRIDVSVAQAEGPQGFTGKYLTDGDKYTVTLDLRA